MPPPKKKIGRNTIILGNTYVLTNFHNRVEFVFATFLKMYLWMKLLGVLSLSPKVFCLDAI